jgi:hypothetical protein
MNLILLGVVSGLDVLANAFVFSGALRSDFDVNEAADFSTVLGWAAVLCALSFGGAEQVVDHRKFVPRNLIGSPSAAALGWIGVGIVLFAVLRITGESERIVAIVLLALILGVRSVARAAAFARGKYRREAVLSLAELGLLIGLTIAGFSILSAYVCAKLLGLPLRINELARFPQSRIDNSHMWGYSFAAIAPALYFNIYYTVLPALATPEVVVRFRFLQSILVPMSFLGSLLARGRIVFAASHDRLMRLLDVPNTSQTTSQWAGSALLPVLMSVLYIGAIALLVTPLNTTEIACTTLYCALIYHRAQLYSHITLRAGPVARARVALGGILLVILSLAPIAALQSPSVAVLYGLLAAVEATLLIVSVAVLLHKSPGLQT